MDVKNIPENLSTAKLSEDIQPGFSMSTLFSFRSIENKHDVYSRKEVKIVWRSFVNT